MTVSQPIFGRQSPAVQPDQVVRQQTEQTKINQLQNKYASVCSCAQCSKPASADTLLNKIKAESYAHILGHEQAHQSAAGGFGGGINIQYDGNGVAVAGHVPISIPGLDSQNPETSLKAYNTIRGAALAPSDPSGQDMSVAAHAQSLMGQAQVLMGQKKQAQSLGIPLDVFRKTGGKPPRATP
jgi:hypothetical protein